MKLLIIYIATYILLRNPQRSIRSMYVRTYVSYYVRHKVCVNTYNYMQATTSYMTGHRIA